MTNETLGNTPWETFTEHTELWLLSTNEMFVTKSHLLNLDLNQIMLAWSLGNPWLPNFPANGLSVYPK